MDSHHRTSRTFPCLDLAAFESDDLEASVKVAKQLVALSHEYGYLAIRGHGLSSESLSQAFEVIREFFALPVEKKMAAPHPPTPKPHRGFSGIGVEKVYSESDMETAGDDASTIRKVKDYKESYEIGSEQDHEQPNIWIPDEIMPKFKPFMIQFYQELDGIASRLIRAFAVGLDLDPAEREQFAQMDSHEQNQLRLLHYPAVSQSELGKTVLSRLPTHLDYSGFTIVFQDKTGGLEFRHPQTGEYSSAEETEDVLFFNIGVMIQQLTNDYFISPEHRVTVPSSADESATGLTARYSIPYFVCPRQDYMIKTLDRFVTSSHPRKYESLRFDEYCEKIFKFQYDGGSSKSNGGGPKEQC